jgi:hypothetical protein
VIDAALLGAAVREHADGALLEVYVQPRAATTEWTGLHDRALRYRIAAVPTDDRANDALRAFIAGQFGIGIGRVTLLRGRTSRRKQVLLKGLSAQRAREILQPRQ